MELSNGNRVYSAESELLIACAQRNLNGRLRERIARLMSGDPDWDYVLRVAARNAVLPMVAATLLGDFSNLLPDVARQRLDDSRREILQRNIFMTGRLLEIVGLLEDNDVPTLPFKGPLLALQAYGDIGLRHYVDLDILVAPSNLRRAVGLLREISYVPLHPELVPGPLGIVLGNRKDVYLRRDDGLVNVELHWKLSGSHFDIGIRTDSLWSRLESIEIAGQSLRTLGFEDLLIYLCLHGSRHGWEKFSWICDVNELIRTRARIDWAAIFSRAEEVGCEKTLLFGLHLVRRYFGPGAAHCDPAPPETESVFSAFGDQIHQQLFGRNVNLMLKGERYHYHLSLKPGRWDRMKLHFEFITSTVRSILNRGR